MPFREIPVIGISVMQHHTVYAPLQTLLHFVPGANFVGLAAVDALFLENEVKDFVSSLALNLRSNRRFFNYMDRNDTKVVGMIEAFFKKQMLLQSKKINEPIEYILQKICEIPADLAREIAPLFQQPYYLFSPKRLQRYIIYAGAIIILPNLPLLPGLLLSALGPAAIKAIQDIDTSF